MIYIALGIVALVALGEGLVIVGFLFAADAENHNPATADLEACAIDSAGRPYRAVPVKACGECGETLPADHQCTGRVAI